MLFRGLQTDRELASLVSDYLSQASKERIHAVGLILPSFMYSLNAHIESDLQLTLSLFPKWMKQNIVPIISFSDELPYEDTLLRHFGLEENRRFFVNTKWLFSELSGEVNFEFVFRKVL